MERNTFNIIRQGQSKYINLFEQNNNNKENNFPQEKKYSKEQIPKLKSPLKYNILTNIPLKGNSKNKNKNINNFKNTRNKKDMYIRNTDESKEIKTNKQNKYILNYEINDFFIKGYNDKKNRKKNLKNKFRNKQEKNKFIKSNSSLNYLEYKTNNSLDSKKFLSNGLQMTLKTSGELNEINKNKLLLSPSFKNLKEYTNKTTNNITSNFSQTINTHNLSIQLPFEATMKNEILDILNLNKNIKINQKEFNTIQNITKSTSTKTFSFNKRKKPLNKSKNYLTECLIDNILKSSNEYNQKEEENKIRKLDNKINKIKEEYIKTKEEKNKLEMTNMIMQNEMRYFQKQKQIEKNGFEKYKQSEIKKLVNEKNKLDKDNKSLNNLKKKYQNKNLDEDENCFKDYIVNKDKELIEIYKNKLDEANSEILKLKHILKNLNINYDNEYNNHFSQNQNKIKKNLDNKNEVNKLSEDYDDESEDNDDDNYDLILPDKYHKVSYKLIKSEKNKEGCMIKTYDKNKTEINLINGDKKEIYGDEYEIIYYSNGDIKQIFKDKNKQVFFFKKQNIIKTTLSKGLQIIKYNNNNQLEKIFLNGTKKISFSDGRLKYILPNGAQETYFPDGSVERKLKDGNIILECGQEIKRE